MADADADEQVPETGAVLAEEAASVSALGVSRDDDGTASVVVPRGPEGDAGRQRGRLKDGPGRPEALVVTSRYTRAEIDAAVRAVQAHASGREGGGHGFGIYYDARRDAVAVITDSPALDREALQDRLGPIVHVEYGAGGRSGA